MFTIGQANRMNNSITSPTAGRNHLWSNSNLIATGVINPVGPCAPVADFTSDKDVICVNGNVGFIDLSYNGAITGWQWEFPGASFSISTVQNPSATFITPGLKTIQLKAANSYGADSISKSIVTVLAGAGSGTVNLPQSFETIVFPDNYWVAKPSSYGTGWIQTSTVAATGSKCVMVDNYFDSPSGPVSIYTPMYDLTSLPNPGLTFNVAYSQNAAGSNDRLRVYYSTDCAVSWSTLYAKSGAALHTLGSGTVAPGPFTSPAYSQWRKESMAFGPAFSSVTGLLLKFEFTPDSVNPGNNIFLDDINVESVTGIFELKKEKGQLFVSPNPASESTKIEFDMMEKGLVSIDLVDLGGKTVRRMTFGEMDKGNKVVFIDVSGLGKGLYILQLNRGETSSRTKLSVD
jgi:PKD repeat protein